MFIIGSGSVLTVVGSLCQIILTPMSSRVLMSMVILLHSVEIFLVLVVDE